MLVDVTFQDGSEAELSSLYICDRKHYMASDDAYLIIPVQDIKISKITPEESSRLMKAAKSLPSIVGSDIGIVLKFDSLDMAELKKLVTEPPKKSAWKQVSAQPKPQAKKQISWSEVKTKD